MLSVACITASQAFCCASLRLPHIRPARLNPPGGKLDQRCFCAVSVQSNSPVSFCVSFSVARKAFAAAVTCCVVELLLDSVAEALAAADGAVAVPEVPEEHRGDGKDDGGGAHDAGEGRRQEELQDQDASCAP